MIVSWIIVNPAVSPFDVGWKPRIKNILDSDYDENMKIALLAIVAANRLEQGKRSKIKLYYKTLPPLLAEKILQTENNIFIPFNK